jgi:hypothetical protein
VASIPAGAVLALPGGRVAPGGGGARTVLLWLPSPMDLGLFGSGQIWVYGPRSRPCMARSVSPSVVTDDGALGCGVTTFADLASSKPVCVGVLPVLAG